MDRPGHPSQEFAPGIYKTALYWRITVKKYLDKRGMKRVREGYTRVET